MCSVIVAFLAYSIFIFLYHWIYVNILIMFVRYFLNGNAKVNLR